MSDYELYSWGSSDCSSLETFNPLGAFFISIEFDLKYKNQKGLITYYFFLCNEEGFKLETKAGNDLEAFKHTIKINNYSYEFVLNHLETVIKPRLKSLNNKELMQYLSEEYYKDES